MKAAGIVSLYPERMPTIGTENARRDEDLEETFSRALGLLNEYLALHGIVAHKSLCTTWKEFETTVPMIAPDLGVVVRLEGRKAIRLGADSTYDPSRRVFYFRDAELAAEKDVGGRVIGRCFDDSSIREQVELAWVYCWNKAEQGDEDTGIALPDDGQDEGDPLSDLEEAARKGARYRSKFARQRKEEISKKTVENKTAGGTRLLKSYSEVKMSKVTLVDGTTGAGGREREIPSPLRNESGGGSSVTSSLSESTGSKRYDNKDVEDLGLHYLNDVLNRAGIEDLKDLRKFRGIGADAVAELKKYFELKSFAGEMPSSVTLTRDELRRANIERKNFHLVVVSGLEQRYESVVVRIYNDPLKNLKWSPKGGATLKGLNSARHLTFTIESGDEESSEGSSSS
jgi:hypothetical protein